jgi:hypothetical protein
MQRPRLSLANDGYNSQSSAVIALAQNLGAVLETPDAPGPAPEQAPANSVSLALADVMAEQLQRRCLLLTGVCLLTCLMWESVRQSELVLFCDLPI